MEIEFTTDDQSQYCYKILSSVDGLPYKGVLETITGNRVPEFTFDALTPTQCIQELKPILNGKGVEIVSIDSVTNWFHPKDFFQDLVGNIVD